MSPHPSGSLMGLGVIDPALEARLGVGMARVEDLLRASVRSDYPFVTEASRHLVDAGGKRFRPLLVLLAVLGDGAWQARTTLAVSTLRRRKRGRETVAGVPSRFIAEMKLGEGVAKEDPRERLRKLREQLAARPAAVVDGA